MGTRRILFCVESEATTKRAVVVVGMMSGNSVTCAIISRIIVPPWIEPAHPSLILVRGSRVQPTREGGGRTNK